MSLLLWTQYLHKEEGEYSPREPHGNGESSVLDFCMADTIPSMSLTIQQSVCYHLVVIPKPSQPPCLSMSLWWLEVKHFSRSFLGGRLMVPCCVSPLPVRFGE